MSDLLTAYADRLTGLDPLLGVTADAPAGEVIAAGSARGWTRVAELDPADAIAVWGKLRTYVLDPRWAGDPLELDTLLVAWSSWLAAHGALDAGPESQTSITWPSRDVAAARVFHRHGLVPTTTVAVRPRGRCASGAAPPDGVTIRAGTPDDAPAVAALGLEELRYDAGLGPATERPESEDARAEHVARLLADPAPWAWVAERDGAPVGVLTAQRPEDATWVTGMTSAAPAAYLSLLSVGAAARGGGVGAALAATAQRTFDEAGLSASLLHHGTFNPLSAPFWARHGYRPLWTIWSTEPAAALR